MGAGRDYFPRISAPRAKRKFKPFVQKTCPKCGAPVRWAKRATGSFVMVDVKGGRHSCPTTVAFDDISEED